MKKEMKKLFAISIISLIFLSLIVVSVYAQETSELQQKAADAAQNVAEGAGSGAKTLLNSLLNPLFSDKEILTRVFFAILLFMIIYQIVDIVFGKKRWATWLIAGIITLLALIWMPVNFIDAIKLEYGAMGAAILSVIPFLILLVFTVRIGSLLAGRIVWIFFVIYYFALYLYEIIMKSTGGWTGWLSAETIPYLGAIIAGLIIFFLLGSIRKALFYGEIGALKESGRQVATKAKLLHKLQDTELQESYGADSAGNR